MAEKKRKTSKNKYELTKLQMNFVIAYIDDPERNATRAAIKAGYAVETANRQGYKLLHNEKILACIRTHEQLKAKSKVVSHDYVMLRRLEVLDNCMAKKEAKIYDYDKKAWVSKGVMIDRKQALIALNDIENSLSFSEDKADEDEFANLIEILSTEEK